jgi:UDP-N-acetylmuramoyl-tripeptide--D-alanyl-D-alanine ligase
MEEICEKINAKLVTKQKIKFLPRISTDTRTIASGDMFVAIKGENFDGHDFINDAFSKKASLIMVNDEFFNANKNFVDLLVTKNTIHALGEIGKCFINKFNVKVIAITGSTGKTTTKEMIKNVLSEKYKVQSTPYNFNNLIGVPKTIFDLDSDTDFLVLEMGTNKKGEIARLVDIAKPFYAIITNIDYSHTEFLGDLNSVREEKSSVFLALPEDGWAIVNMDDSNVMMASSHIKTNKFYYSLKDKKADLFCSQYEFLEDFKTRAKFILKEKEFEIILPLIGTHNIYNVMSAIALGYLNRIEFEKIKHGITSQIFSHERSEIIKLKNSKYLINDCYNANPLSMKAAINLLDQLKKNNKGLAILGDMLELGSYAEKKHYELGVNLANSKIEYVVAIGEFAKFIKEGAKKNTNIKIFEFKNKEEAKEKIFELLNYCAWILIKASRGMHFEIMVLDLIKS